MLCHLLRLRLNTFLGSENLYRSGFPERIPGEGFASGVLATSRVISQAVSVALAGSLFTASGAAAAGIALSAQRPHLSVSRISALQQTFMAGFHAAFTACAALGILTSVVRGNESIRQADEEHS